MMFPHMSLCQWTLKFDDGERVNGVLMTHHVESDDIFERNLAGPMALYQNLVDDLGAAAGGQT